VSAPAVAQLAATSSYASSGHGGQQEHGQKASGHEAKKDNAIRYGMVIDMRKLYGKPELMEKAIKACHTIHNVPHFEEKKNEIKWIWSMPFENVFPEHSSYHASEVRENNEFLTLCNHCDEPPCVRVCPTKATFRTDDGSVAMDYHRCIGCRFCMMGCPYGARSFNWYDPRDHIETYNPEYPTRTRGVVEKCNFCADQLALGKEPACVEALKETGALVFGDLNDPSSEIRRILQENPTIQRKPALGTKPSVFYI
ncbi:unnamed protein product, partial [Cyprideis torosa]